MDKLLDKYFSTKKRHVTMGVEVEMYLYDAENECLLQQTEEYDKILDECFSELPESVTKDFYNYQLEVRTKPHDNPESLIKEFQETLLLCRNVFLKHNIEIKPLSWLGGEENFNGLHIHFRNGKRTLYQTSMFNMYPFVLALTDSFKNSVDTENYLSRRWTNSNHLGIPSLEHLGRRLVGENRYRDIIVNGYTDNNRHRLKREPTIEVRTFDVPYNFEYFKNLMRLMFNLYSYINTSFEIKPYAFEEAKQKIVKTRQDIAYHRDGYNFYFNKRNREIYTYLCDKFKIEQLQTPVVLLQDNIIQNRDKLNSLWRKLGTKVWLGEDKVKQTEKPIEKPIYCRELITRLIGHELYSANIDEVDLPEEEI